jgi:hypothetical protein
LALWIYMQYKPLASWNKAIPHPPPSHVRHIVKHELNINTVPAILFTVLCVAGICCRTTRGRESTRACHAYASSSPKRDFYNKDAWHHRCVSRTRCWCLCTDLCAQRHNKRRHPTLRRGPVGVHQGMPLIECYLLFM